MMRKKLLMIVNPMAGKKQSRSPLYDAAAAFSDADYLLRIHNTACRGDATAIVAREGRKYDLVVCSGGDGTLNETIAGLMQLEENKRPLLGYLPRGSTNDFAASLHIPSNNLKAAQNILLQREQKLDIGYWNDRPFVYVASFGAFTRSSYAASQSSKNALGHFAYLLEGLKDLDTLRPYKVKITADGDVLDGEYLFGAVCNSTSIGGLMKLSPERVVLDDGKFEMLLIPNPKTPLGLQNLIFALMNQEYDAEGLIFRHVSSVTVEPEEDLPWSLDGEFAPSLERVDIVNRQAALTMLL
jgi:diacylglycerol kinase (ATP)